MRGILFYPYKVQVIVMYPIYWTNSFLLSQHHDNYFHAPHALVQPTFAPEEHVLLRPPIR